MPLVKDTNGNLTQLGRLGPAQAVSVSASSTQSTALSASTCFMVRLLATQDCYVAFGTNPTATTSSTRIIANQPEYFAAKAGDKVAVLRVSADGSLSVTEMI